MKKIIFAFIIGLTVISCNEEIEETVDPVEDTELVIEKNGMYTEYYPGKKQIRIEGPLDDLDERDGRWVYFSEEGRQLNFTLYSHGKKHGHSFNSYPNGSPYYYGEYWNDSLVGIWKSYDTKGVVTEKDYGYPEGY
jgi:antitoxin component YwqK of YwqJK toxin-antitoxin module